MLKKDSIFRSQDSEAIKVLEDFLPERIFDAHAHLFDSIFLPNTFKDSKERIVGDIDSYKEALMPMLCNPKKLFLNIITYPDRSMSDRTYNTYIAIRFFKLGNQKFI